MGRRPSKGGRAPGTLPAARAGASLAEVSGSDREKWDARYRDALPAVPQAVPWLEPWLRGRRGQQALDVACGRGGLALWLAGEGLSVTALDVSGEALRLLRAGAATAGLAVSAVQRDVDTEAAPAGPFDVVTCFAFKPPGGLAAWLATLKAGGVLCCETATVENLTRHAHPSRRYLVEPDEWLEGLPDDVEVGLREVGWFGDRHLRRLVLCRRG